MDSAPVQARRSILRCMFTYDFGYPWWLVNGHAIPLVLFGTLAGVAIWRRWRWWLAAFFAVVTVWSLVSLLFLQMLRTPASLPSERFLASGRGRVLDVGAGSGRLAIGVLQARPDVRVTALDIYSGYLGIRFASLLPHHSMEHPALNTARWRGRLEGSGFEVTEQGTRPATLYFVSRKR